MVVYECEVGVIVKLNPMQTKKAMRALNKHYIKSETIPLDVPSNELPKELLDATSRVASSLAAKLKVKIHSDGSFEISV
jgi:hypothetical protein